MSLRTSTRRRRSGQLGDLTGEGISTCWTCTVRRVGLVFVGQCWLELLVLIGDVRLVASVLNLSYLWYLWYLSNSWTCRIYLVILVLLCDICDSGVVFVLYILYNNSMWCIYCVIFDVWICEPCNCEKIGQKNDNFAECIYHSTRQRWLSQGPWDPDFPSVFALALGKDLNFVECQEKGTQQSWGVCWVPLARNMAMVRGMLSVVRQTLGKLLIFAECLSVSTRQSHR